MTSPASGYYENILRGNLRYRWQYRQCRWHWFYAPQRIRSFSWEHSCDLYTYRKGSLTVQKAPVSPDWQVPPRYHKPVRITLTRKQEASIRTALQKVSFSRLNTGADSFVNLLKGGMITENFLCRFPLGFSFRFVSRSRQAELAPLAQVLEQIAGTAKDWQEISQMEAWLFTDQRWEQLHP